jgi:hypothetical protein
VAAFHFEYDLAAKLFAVRTPRLFAHFERPA